MRKDMGERVMGGGEGWREGVREGGGVGERGEEGDVRKEGEERV